MKLECPYGWKSVARVGSVTLESRVVNICGNICDSADRCGIKRCEFYDLSPEADRHFREAIADEQTIEYQLTKLH
ncbi:MAG: hypothetical protein MSG64_21045 [Pyrinomonadaceae bacterium MAG19_C2-C3]|nr:hypothetical protein [Pyrinomonadaceae bacterium MAG19_C2-C3]